MRAGKLDKIITIERKTETVADSGSVVAAWSTIATVRAERVELATLERATGFGEADYANAIFRAWWRPGITTADRLVHDGVAYDIKEVVEIGRRRALELRCELVK